MAYELQKRGLTPERQKPMPILYDNIRFDEAFRSDLVVDGKVNCRTQIRRGIASRECEAASDPIASERP